MSMNAHSLPPPPVTDEDTAGARPWGQSVDRVAPISAPVTPDLTPLGGSTLLGDAEIAQIVVARRAARRDEEAERVRGLLLEQLHQLGEWPPPAGPARPAFPTDLPAVVTNFRNAAVEPWRTRAYFAPSGSVPYTFERKRAGWLATEIAYLRLAHPDGRRAVAVWVRDQLAERGKAGAKVWGLAWSWSEGWRWRVGPDGTRPVAIGSTQLKAAVGDPTYRENPYTIEEAA